MKKSRATLLIIGLVALFIGWRWWGWAHGRIVATADVRANSARAVIREFPTTASPIDWVFDTSGYVYRLEVWRWPHFMTDCITYSEDSFRARTARIDYTRERTTFYLDDRVVAVLTFQGWKRE